MWVDDFKYVLCRFWYLELKRHIDYQVFKVETGAR